VAGIAETAMKAMALAAALALCSGAAIAQEASGCDKFKFPVDRERAALGEPDQSILENGGALEVGKPFQARLTASAAVRFETAPARASAPDSFGAVLKLPMAPAAGAYTISVSGPAWLDVLQDGAPIKPSAFSGVRDCPNIRKVLKYQLAAKPATIQISNAKQETLAIVVLESR